MIDILTLTHSCGAHSLVGSSITSLRCAQNSFESQAIWPLFSMKLQGLLLMVSKLGNQLENHNYGFPFLKFRNHGKNNCAFTGIFWWLNECYSYDGWILCPMRDPRLSTYAWNWESGESVIYFNILVPPNLIENDHNFVFFGYKVTIQQNFKSNLFWKTKT